MVAHYYAKVALLHVIVHRVRRADICGLTGKIERSCLM